MRKDLKKGRETEAETKGSIDDKEREREKVLTLRREGSREGGKKGEGKDRRRGGKNDEEKERVKERKGREGERATGFKRWENTVGLRGFLKYL